MSTHEPNGSEGATATRYLGSKVRVASAILDLVGEPTGSGVFVDPFAGTGVVSREAAMRGWNLRINDHLRSASQLALGNILSRKQVPFVSLGGYEAALARLNRAPTFEGFIWREYSPRSARHAPAERRYFSEENASAIDGMRQQIAHWVDEHLLTPHEEGLLIADLLVAASRVANTAGTFGCFMRGWQQNALLPLTLVPRKLLPRTTAVEVFCQDVSDVAVNAGDTVYLDPPYTKRQYAAYYHILETIAAGDEPEVGGVTGLRPWKQKASRFCYRRKALGAVVELVERMDAGRVLLSYSSEGHVALPELMDELGCSGRVALHELAEIGRYTPNEQARGNGETVVEYLLEYSAHTRPEQ